MGGAVSEFTIFIENFIQNYYGIFPLSKDLQLKRTKIKVQGMRVYLDPNEMSGRGYFCTCPQTILLSEKEIRICTLFTHR